MANAVETNFRTGGNALRAAFAEVTLESGTGTVNVPFSTVKYVFITQKDATAVAEGWSWDATAGVITIDSSNGSSAETLSVQAFGY